MELFEKARLLNFGIPIAWPPWQGQNATEVRVSCSQSLGEWHRSGRVLTRLAETWWPRHVSGSSNLVILARHALHWSKCVLIKQPRWTFSIAKESHPHIEGLTVIQKMLAVECGSMVNFIFNLSELAYLPPSLAPILESLVPKIWQANAWSNIHIIMDGYWLFLW